MTSTLRGVKFVHQLHDGCDAGVEVPAALEIVADALDGLVQFALDFARFRRQRRCEHVSRRAGALRIAGNESVDAAQEALMPSTPSSCQSSSRSGGVANNVYMRVASAP